MRRVMSEKPRLSRLACWVKAAVLGLQCKFTVPVVTLTLCVATLMGGLFFRLAGRLTARLEQEHSVRLCSLLAQLAAKPMGDGDLGELTELAHKFATGDPLLFVSFCDAEGGPLASASRNGAAPAPAGDHRQTVGTPVLRKGIGEVPAYLDVSYPVNRPADAGGPAHPMLIGYARVGFNVDPTLREFASVMDLVSGTALVVVLVTIPLAFMVVRQIVVPLNDLARTAARVAGGDLTARSRVNRKDEIGRLAQAFNHMADELAGHETRITAINADLEERVRQRTQQLREMAVRDPLTQLYNRRHFDEVLGRSFSEARRYEHPLSCLMIDLDNFKAVNDLFGHHTGDKALVLASLTIISQLRSSDLAARFGGDEFVVLLPHTDNHQAQILARRIAEKFTQDAAEQLAGVNVRLSIGIASMEDALPDVPESLVRTADRALYDAKQRGKDRVEVSRVRA